MTSDPHVLHISTPVKHDPVIHESRRRGRYARIPVFCGMCGCRRPPYVGPSRRTVEEAWADLRAEGHVQDPERPTA